MKKENIKWMEVNKFNSFIGPKLVRIWKAIICSESIRNKIWLFKA